MEYNVLFLSLLAGYIFVSTFKPTRYWIGRQSNYHVLFVSAIAGVCFLVISTLMFILILKRAPDKNWGFLFGIPWLLPSISTLPLATLFLLLNLIPRFKGKAAIMRAAGKRNDTFELMLLNAFYESKPIAISLKSGKVYIGIITGKSGTPGEERKHIQILPVLSGFRDPASKRLAITTNYAKVIKELDFNLSTPYDIVFPVSEVESIRYHDPYLFSNFQAKSQ